MVRKGIAKYGMSIRLACETYGISETCYRYQARLDGENAVIADWPLKLTQTYKRWGFGLCFLYLRNVRVYSWNRKPVALRCESLPHEVLWVQWAGVYLAITGGVGQQETDNADLYPAR